MKTTLCLSGKITFNYFIEPSTSTSGNSPHGSTSNQSSATWERYKRADAGDKNTAIIIMRKYYVLFIRICVLVGCFLLITSCEHAPSYYSSRDTIALLTKCKDFMSFCIMILNQPSDVYYNQLSSRYYYAIYMLGRIVSGPRRLFWSTEGDNMASHKKVWDSCPDKPKEVFGTELKDLRVKSDYSLDTPDLGHSGYPRLLNEVVGNDDAFNELIDKVDSVCSVVSSRRDYQEEYTELIEEIKEMRARIKTRLSSLS